MSKNRVVISTSSLNSYGTRILTDGVDIQQYQRNPVLLYMHQRGQVIGFIKNLRIDNDAITGEPVFDEATDLSRQCKRQWDFGSLNMVSAGFDIIETSDNPALLVQGQTHATITRAKLFEVSIVDIGANDDALRLRFQGNDLQQDNIANAVSLVKTNQPNCNNNNMDLKQLNLALGLDENATEQQLSGTIQQLRAAQAENQQLHEQLQQLRQQQITAMVDAAVADHRLQNDNRQTFITLGQDIGAEKLQQILNAMNPAVRLSATISPDAPAQKAPSDFHKLSEVPEEQIALMRKQNPSEYKRLFKAEYGFNPDLSE